ncbi:MAG TPA: AAA family ATPase, partial [Candidatus Andersenbacteria bacterium]|nr:AAA family ATPase [Candidatus Andersenbacteria bacterium]
TGKSSLCKHLNSLGYIAYDIDAVPGLCSWRSKKTGEIGDYYPNIGREWLDQYDWICDEEKLKKLFVNNKDVLICGISSNQKKLLPLFEKVILLTLDNDLLRQRLANRTGENEFAKTESEQLHILEWKDDWEKETLEAGAVQINANQPLESIVKEILELLV